MEIAIIGVVFFLVLLLVALYFGVSKQRLEIEPKIESTIQASGLYSVVRKSPRALLAGIRPSLQEIRQYLSKQNENIGGCSLSEKEKESLIDAWNQSLEKSIQEIETGDKQQTEFYFYDFTGDDPVCKTFVSRGCFITRRELHDHPELIPPFHLGCTCALRQFTADGGDIRETTISRMTPFVKSQSRIRLPDWKQLHVHS